MNEGARRRAVEEVARLSARLEQLHAERGRDLAKLQRSVDQAHKAFLEACRSRDELQQQIDQERASLEARRNVLTSEIRAASGPTQLVHAFLDDLEKLDNRARRAFRVFSRPTGKVDRATGRPQLEGVSNQGGLYHALRTAQLARGAIDECVRTAPDDDTLKKALGQWLARVEEALHQMEEFEPVTV